MKGKVNGGEEEGVVFFLHLTALKKMFKKAWRISLSSSDKLNQTIIRICTLRLLMTWIINKIKTSLKNEWVGGVIYPVRLLDRPTLYLEE